MIMFLQLVLFFFFNILAEIVYRISKPFLRPILARISYADALMAEGPFIDGGVLIHAASLGEVNAVRSLVLELRKHMAPWRIAITTTTVAGLKAAEAIDPEIRARLSVFDIFSARKKQLDAISPGLICIVETEIWPNLLYCAKQKGIPVLFLNARLGVRSKRRLTLIKPLLSYIGTNVKEIMAKSELDAERFRDIMPVPVRVAGNLKFALRPPEYDIKVLRDSWGFEADDMIICAGSTRPGEDKLFIQAFEKLKTTYPNMKLILAPRHPARIDGVKNECMSLGFRLFSELSKEENVGPILIIDQLGHLNQAYCICDLAIVGGSFYNFGGHNPLEPAFYGKAILIGPYHASCLESVQELVNHNAITICDKQELIYMIQKMIDNPHERGEMGSRAKEVIEIFQKSLYRHLEGVLKWIK